MLAYSCKIRLGAQLEQLGHHRSVATASSKVQGVRAIGLLVTHHTCQEEKG